MTEYLTNVIHNIITVLLLFRSLLYTIVELLYGDLPWRADCLAKTPRVKLAKSGSSHHNAAGTSSEPHRMRVMLQKVAFNDDPTALFDGAVSSTWPRAAPRAFAVVTVAVVSSTTTVASSSSASGVSSAGASAATAAADVSSVSTAQVIFFLFCCRTEYYTKINAIVIVIIILRSCTQRRSAHCGGGRRICRASASPTRRTTQGCASSSKGRCSQRRAPWMGSARQRQSARRTQSGDARQSERPQRR